MGRLLDRILGRADAARPLASGTRADGYGGRWTNASTGQGGYMHRASQTTYQTPIALDQATIDAMMRFEAVARRICTREPEDCTREGYELEGMPADMAESLRREADGMRDDGTTGLDVLNKIAKARTWARAFGGGAIFVLADDGLPADQPLDVSRLRAVRGLEVFDRYELAVSHYGIDPHDYRTFGRPQMYVTAGVGVGALRIHASRVIPFQGLDLPERTMIANGGWGGSVLDVCWAALRDWSTVNEYAAEAVTLLTQGVFYTKHAGEAVDAGDESAVAQRFAALRAAMGLMGDLVLDKESEEYKVHPRNLTGLKEAAEIGESALVASSEMPVSILLGRTPGGLNAGENLGELEAWYGHCGSIQPKKYTPPLRRILALIMLSKDGPTGGQLVPGWGVEWRPLWTLDEKEQAQVDLTRAQRRSIDVTSGVVSAQEARREPALVELYSHDPDAAAPAPPGEPPGSEVEEGLDDDSMLEPVAVADPNDFPQGEQPVSARQVAERLGVSPGTVIKMATRGDFPVWKVANRYRFAMSTVEDYLRRGRLQAVQ